MRTKDKKPLKPDRPVGVLVFPKKGGVYRKMEHFPRDQDELELTMGKKFLGSLSHFRGVQLSNLHPGSGRGDLLCTDKEGKTIKIQVVEIVNEQHRLLTEMRSSYSQAVETNFAEVLSSFSGCKVTLVDDGWQEPYLPSIRTSEGKRCLQELGDGLQEIGSESSSLDCKKIRLRHLEIGPHCRRIGVVCERFAPSGKDVPFQFSWSGGLPGYKLGEPRNLLTRAVLIKIGKQYSKPTEPFWLLAYSTDTLLSEDDAEIIETGKLLGENKHPFDEVWYMYPRPVEDLGFIVRIWP